MIVTEDADPRGGPERDRAEPRDAVHEGHARRSRAAASRCRRCSCLKDAGAEFAAMDILPDPRIRQLLSRALRLADHPAAVRGRRAGRRLRHRHRAVRDRQAEGAGSPPHSTAAVVGAGVIGLSAARALARRRVRGHGLRAALRWAPRWVARPGARASSAPATGTTTTCGWRGAPSTSGRGCDPALLLRNGLLEYGRGVEQHAAALDALRRAVRVARAGRGERLFPEARFPEPVLWTPTPARCWPTTRCARLRPGPRRARRARASPTRAQLEADVVVVCPGSWLSRLFDLPLYGQIEQVCVLRGAPEPRPSLIDHGGGAVDRLLLRR